MEIVIARWSRLGALRVFLEASVALFVGLAVWNLVLGSSGGQTTVSNPLWIQFSNSPTKTVLRGITFPALETLFWQALFFQSFARLGFSRWVPLLLSAILFATLLHWQRGVLPVLEAFWFWLILGLVYASQRIRSFWRAFALTTTVHWGPILFLAFAPLIVRDVPKPALALQSTNHDIERTTSFVASGSPGRGDVHADAKQCCWS